jgi:hypothetical protein
MLKKLLVKGVLPSREYFLVAAQRLLTDKELSDLKPIRKQQYINKKV